MVATMTVSGILTEASGVVSEFGTVIGIVAGITLGIFFVTWIASKIKAAKR